MNTEDQRLARRIKENKELLTKAVIGPSSSTDGEVAVFGNTTGRAITGSGKCFSGNDNTVVTGSKGANGNLAQWNADGDLVDAESGWINVSSMSNNWVNYGGPTYGVAAYKKIGKRVYLRGLIKSGTLNKVAFTLPTDYRPQREKILSVAAANSPGYVYVQKGGGVYISSTCSATWTSLDSISFDVD